MSVRNLKRSSSNPESAGAETWISPQPAPRSDAEWIACAPRSERELFLKSLSRNALLALPWLDLTLQLGEESVAVGDAALTLRCEPFGISEQLLHYRLVTPVLLLKSENYRRYQGLDERGQRAERDRLLVSNLLTAMRGLDIHFPVQLYAAFTRSRLRPCHYKGQELIGIDGEMACNAVLPEGLAIGHAVSHGFGWLVAG